jgi:hypothetical protein
MARARKTGGTSLFRRGGAVPRSYRRAGRTSVLHDSVGPGGVSPKAGPAGTPRLAPGQGKGPRRPGLRRIRAPFNLSFPGARLLREPVRQKGSGPRRAGRGQPRERLLAGVAGRDRPPDSVPARPPDLAQAPRPSLSARRRAPVAKPPRPIAAAARGDAPAGTGPNPSSVSGVSPPGRRPGRRARS